VTGAIIRGRLFPKGVSGGSAKFNKDPDAVVQLPAKKDWDHYDAHVFEACQILHIPCKVEGDHTYNVKGEGALLAGLPAPGYSISALVDDYWGPPASNLKGLEGVKGEVVEYYENGVIVDFNGPAVRLTSQDMNMSHLPIGTLLRLEQVGPGWCHHHLHMVS
jgi:hypothetical protein